jgi:hypothetical protein
MSRLGMWIGGGVGGRIGDFGGAALLWVRDWAVGGGFRSLSVEEKDHGVVNSDGTDGNVTGYTRDKATGS